jgi:squalene-hopene cyclase-like protein
VTAPFRRIGAAPAIVLLLLAAPTAAGEPAGEAPRTEEAVRKGIDWLLAAQRKDGSWGAPASGRPVEVLADVPGSHRAFRVGATALCVLALDRSPFRAEECAAASRRGLEYLVDRCRVRRPNGAEMYNVWAFAYSLRVFAAVLPRIGQEDGALRDRILERSRELVKALSIYQTPDGGWGYYDFDVGSYRPSDSSMTFTTATALVSLHAIAKEGVPVPKALVDRAIRSLRRSRKADGSYIYGPYAQYRPAVEYNEVKGSLGRAHSCNLALWLHHEAVAEEDLRAGIERFFKHHRFMDIGRKRPMPHEAWYYTSGYYFYYGHYYARLVLDVLPAADRERWLPALEKILVERQEADGSWWDFPLYGYHKPYGTAYALLTLIR